MTIFNCPPMSWDEFIRIPDGTEVFNHGASECVALANQFNEGVLGGGFVNVSWAINWWDNPNVAPVHGFERITHNPQVGDIFIGSYGVYNAPYGHIGVVTRAWDGSTFGTIEQNAGIAYAVSRHDRTMANIDGFLRPLNQSVFVTASPLAGNQRIAGPNGVFRREEPNTSSARLDPDLEANEVGNFVGWIYGENVNGNNVWFQGVSGNWFWSGAFTDAGTHDLADLNPAPVISEPVVEIVVPTPEPVIPPVEETGKVESEVVEPEIVLEEKPVATLTEKEIAEINARQQAYVEKLPEADLGAIIPTAKGRKIAYAIYASIALAVTNTAVGYTALQEQFPAWLLVSVAVVGNLAAPFAALAMANAKK